MSSKIGIVGLVVACSPLLAAPASAELVCGPSYSGSEFSSVEYKQPGDPQRPGMWFINFGNGQQYYDRCGESSCITAQSEDGADFVRLTVNPDPTPGDYVDTEASELQTGYSYRSPCADIHPTPGHPVEVLVRLRCTSCMQDGSGGHVGTWGVWLWNGYPDIVNGVHPITAMGFNWIEQGGYFPPGLAFSVLSEDNPTDYQPVRVPVIDLRQWHVYGFVWESSGVLELVTYSVDGVPVGATVIVDPVTPMGELSLTIWHDNQLPVDPTAFPATVVQNPSVAQNLDVDYVRVNRP